MFKLVKHYEPDIVVKEIISEDSVVIARIVRQVRKLKDGTSSQTFLANVKRNYATGVYLKQDEFTTQGKAEIWLEVVYQDELNKHIQKVLDDKSGF